MTNEEILEIELITEAIITIDRLMCDVHAKAPIYDEGEGDFAVCESYGVTTRHSTSYSLMFKSVYAKTLPFMVERDSHSFTNLWWLTNSERSKHNALCYVLELTARHTIGVAEKHLPNEVKEITRLVREQTSQIYELPLAKAWVQKINHFSDETDRIGGISIPFAIDERGNKIYNPKDEDGKVFGYAHISDDKKVVGYSILAAKGGGGSGREGKEL